MRTQRATSCLQTLAIGRPTLETGIAAATDAAGSDLGAQLQDRQLGKQTVHPADRAEVAAPKALLKAQRANHGSGGDHQQQTATRSGRVLQIPDLLPNQDQGKASG